MNVLVRRTLILAIEMLLAGCGGEPEPLPLEAVHQAAPLGEGSVPAASPELPASEQPTLGAEERQSATGGSVGSPPEADPAPVSPPPAGPLGSPPPARTSASSASASIDLSAGVALPQSLPTGTAMGMSVDYRFTAGEPQPSRQYVWVIEPAMGDPVRQPVRLSTRGTLQAFFPQLHPRNGPFQAHIESPDGSRLSNSVSLE